MRLRAPVQLALLCLLGGAGAVATAAPASNQLLVAATAALTEALQDASEIYAHQSGQTVQLTFGGSAALAHQIETGTVVDVFIPADTEWMDYLEKHSLTDPATRRNLAGDRLVIIAPKDSNTQLDIGPHFDLAGVLGKHPLALPKPETTPAGRYGRYALIALGAWNTLGERVLTTDNVRATLDAVASGTAMLGIVYESDALQDKRLRIAGVFPEGSHPKIVYPIALTRTAQPGAARYLEFLRTPAARAIFTRYGFRGSP